MRRIAFTCDGPGCDTKVTALPREHLDAIPLPAGWLAIDAQYLVSAVGRPGVTRGQRARGEVCSIQCAIRRTSQLLAAMDNVNEAPPARHEALA